jgi:predicted metal-dependent enzyme (double-stranded beta helix superfamily)
MVVMDILDTFLTDCRDAVGTGQQAVLGVVSQTLTDPERFAAAVRARPKPWFFAADDEVTVFCTEARPGSASAPHSHGTWSVLGCFDGSEESWWHRPAEPSSGMDRLDVVGSGVLRAGEAHALASDVVHAVMNRWTSPNGIVHVYAGNFLASERHIWDPVTGERHDAGLSEPLAPSDTDAPPAVASTSLPLAGTAFAALSVTHVDEVTNWLANALGLQALTTQDDTCAVGEEFVYLIEPSSLTIVGVHQAPSGQGTGVTGLDHLALRVPTMASLEQWRTSLEAAGHQPSAITQWRFGTFTQVVGPDGVTVRLFVPAVR